MLAHTLYKLEQVPHSEDVGEGPIVLQSEWVLSIVAVVERDIDSLSQGLLLPLVVGC